MLPPYTPPQHDESLINLIRDRLNDIPAILDKVSNLSSDVSAMQVQQQVLVESNERIVTMIEGNGKAGLKDRVLTVESKVGTIEKNMEAEKQHGSRLDVEKVKVKLSTRASLILAFVTMLLNIIVTLVTVKISS